MVATQKSQVVGKRLIWPAIVIATLAIIWMAEDMKFIHMGINVGPIAVLAVAVVLLINEYRQFQ